MILVSRIFETIWSMYNNTNSTHSIIISIIIIIISIDSILISIDSILISIDSILIIMVKHTQTIRRQLADELFECVWPL